MGRAPTVNLFLPEAKLCDLVAALDEVAERFQLTSSAPMGWIFPDVEHWRVLIDFDEKALESYSDDRKELVCAEVGSAPSIILRILLNHRVVNEACDMAKALAVHLLGRFYGIVDDSNTEDFIWNIEQIRNTKHGVNFLDCYR